MDRTISLVLFFDFFSRNFNTSSKHNQSPVNEMIPTGDTGCDKDGKDTLIEVAGQKITERVDITLEKLSAHFFQFNLENMWALSFNCLFLCNTRIKVSYLRFWHNFGVVTLKIPEKDKHTNVIVGNPRHEMTGILEV